MSGRTYLETGGKKIRKIFLMTGDHDSGEIVNATYDGGILHYDAVSNLHEVEIKEAYSYPGNRNVYTSAHDVHYHIDQNNVQIIDVDDGEDCITAAPTATKSGWSLVGWRSDTVASGSVLPSKTSDDDSIHLYAVFKQTVTVTLYNNSATATTQKGSKYYNNGNIANPSFAPVVATVSGWNIRGWSTGSGASAAINYNSGASFTTGSNITLYASWSKTVTVSYNGNGATSGSTANSTGTAYRNYKGDVTNASITLRANGYARSGYNFTGKWALGSSGGTQYSVGASVALSSNTTFYACWRIAEKTLECNNINFPNASASYEGTHSSGSSTSGPISAGGHTAQRSGGVYARTGSFNTAEYSSIVVNIKAHNWGSNPPGAGLLFNGTAVWEGGGENPIDVTIPLNGATTGSIELRSTWSLQPWEEIDCWLDVELNSVRFIP